MIGGLGLGIAVLAGFNYYQNSKLEAQLEGSAMYESLYAACCFRQPRRGGDCGQRARHANYADTSYAAQAKLAMARLYMDKNRDQDAADILNELLAIRLTRQLKHVARARLARICLYQGKQQEVVDLLEGQDSAAFAAIYNELLGDAYHASGVSKMQQAAYQRVLLDPWRRQQSTSSSCNGKRWTFRSQR